MSANHHKKKGRSCWEEYKDRMKAKTKLSIKRETQQEVKIFWSFADVLSLTNYPDSNQEMN